MEKLLGDNSANLVIAGKSKKVDNEKIKRLAYYYISKLLKKKIIRKTEKYEKQGSGQKPLMIYEIIK